MKRYNNRSPGQVEIEGWPVATGCVSHHGCTSHLMHTIHLVFHDTRSFACYNFITYYYMN